MPFLRLSLPCILGILVQYYTNISYLVIAFSGFGLLSIICHLILKDKYAYRHLFGIGIFCLFFSLSCLLTKQELEASSWDYPIEKCTYRLKILEDPTAKSRSFQCKVRIESTETNSGWKRINKKAIVYIPKDSLSGSLKAGDFLTSNIRLEKPRQFVSGSSFDYVTYLKNKGYACIGYVSCGDWSLTVEQNWSFPDLKIEALTCQRYLLNRLKKILPGDEEYGIAAGVLFGSKEALNDELKNAFSATGGAHVLVVSGLHVAILYALLFFPFKFLGNGRKIKRLRQILILPLMWGFAFITGLTPSVVRATTMFSFYGLSEIIGKKAFSLNTVSVSAFLMLIHSPLYLFDVGFQLSFFAVFAIITLNPLLQGLFESKNPLINYIWSLLTVSTSAQIGTAPLCIYYFHQFPLVFLLTNLFVIPLVTIILVEVLVYVTISCFWNIPDFLVTPLHFTLRIFMDGIKKIMNIPYACVTDLFIDYQGVISLYFSLFLLILLFFRKKIVYVYMLALLVLFQVIHYL